ncbi:putative virion structural protein [Erwinia phage pEa_SNUABM_8]|nr:putative virion structural protein [Erwinia phage pEa_SNUABM_8]QVW54931.1 hypothetical protein pEaSNUABM4_00178 [Erwinia phage pEa_SNUABM_4]
MGITIKWDSQADQNLDAIEVYRSTSRIDENNPGTPIATLAATATEYVDNNVRVGNTYYYSVAVVKGANRSFGANQTQGYYSNLGPGPQKVIRGDWVRGYFGEMTPAEWVTPVDVANKIKDQLKSVVGMSFATSTSGTWFKFVYKGKIILVNTTALVSATNWTNMYNAGFIYGTDDFGKTPTGDAGAVNQRCVIEVGGYQFLVRGVRMSDKPFTEYITTQEDFNKSEWKSTYARLKSDSAALTDPTILPRFNDNGTSLASVSAHAFDATNQVSIAAATPEVLGKAAKTGTQPVLVVLELLQ